MLISLRKRNLPADSGDDGGDGKGADGIGWVPADSPEGRKIIRDAYGAEEKCQQGRAFFSR